LVIEEKGKPIRIKANASDNPLIRAAYATYASGKRTGAASGDSRMHFDSSAGVVDLAVTPQTDNAGLDWTMLVAIPRADHMGNLRNTVIQNIAIGALAVAIAISFGLWFSQRIARDVTRLSEATRLLASGQSPAAFDVNRADELGSIAKSMAQMSAGILTDPLTGALNRSTFEKRFDALQTQRGGAQSVSGAVVFVDLNVGDAVLAVSAQRLASALRRSDLLGRFGGDEFLLLLVDLGSQRDIDAALDRFREQLRAPIRVAGKSLSVNASFGVARFPEDGTTLNALTQKADERMYDNKHQRKLKLVVNDER
jgi:diguanylate cyclase (GGDEF)-like protein